MQRPSMVSSTSSESFAMSAPTSPTLNKGSMQLPRWAKVDQFTTSGSTRKVMLAAGAAVALLFIVFGVSQASGSSFKSMRAQSSQKPEARDPINDVYNRTLGFEKIFVINMPSRSDLRDSMALAAGFSNLTVEFIDGVHLDEVNEMMLPAEHPDIEKMRSKSLGNLGSWRAHMNAVRAIVEQNLGSALIVEADVDWDIRIHDQMYDFAKAARLLVQPTGGPNSTFLDPTYPRSREGEEHQDFDVNEYQVSTPTTSPYGDIDRWDMHWLGHCGMNFPTSKNPKVKLPLGRAIIPNDNTTVAPNRFRKDWGGAELIHEYPPHTRVVTRARNNVCTLAYALSQQGARNVIWELGLRKMNSAFDIMLRDVCDGTSDRPMSICLSLQPQLFQHHLPVGKTMSNIHNHIDSKPRKKAETSNIRLSVKTNLKNLVRGKKGHELIDSFPDPV
ncbi:hypothetical protein AC579_4396 [Pseudocercospora musae]|uniref:Glycosyltransferase family 25 protein n=1 Tax=Pseudocercospora musae TaxID=113226 RepID=A0A139IK56_9PEZI|nr:hypothetical protein AC579_4396 [Pseudocercospora musae]